MVLIIITASIDCHCLPMHQHHKFVIGNSGSLFCLGQSLRRFVEGFVGKVKGPPMRATDFLERISLWILLAFGISK